MRRILVFGVMVFSTLTSYAQDAETGMIAGNLVDNDMNGEPLPFANVIVNGTTKGATTDMHGLFEISELEPGVYNLTFSFIGYETLTLPNVKVVAGKVTEINAALGSSAAALDEVLITTVARKDSQIALLIDQKEAIVMKQSIGAQEMSRKAVGNVAKGLEKISGITIVEDRGIFVRGLDDRYNYLLMNGLPLPSSDPDYKIIPLDYISTDIVSSIDVFKTFSPDLYQDFAGATFQINTKTAPARPTTIISYGFEANTNTTFQDFYTDDSGVSEFFGYTGDGRDLPPVFSEGQPSYAASPTESANLFDTSWTPKKTSAPLTTEFGISHGQRLFDTGETHLGLFFSMNFQNEYSTQEGVERALNSEGSAQQDFQTVNYNYSTQKSGLFSLNYEKEDRFNLVFNTIYIQNSSNFIREALGLNNNYTQLNDEQFFIRDIKYTENSVLAFQLLNHFEWADKKHQIEIAASAGIGENNVPDRRVLRTENEGENAEYIVTNGINPFKFYQTLDNNNISGKLEYQYSFNENEDRDFDTNIRIGYNLNYITYDFFNRYVTLLENFDGILPNLNTNNPQAFINEGFKEGYLFYQNTRDPQESSEVVQTINAAYFNVMHKWDSVILDAGVRVEQAVREIIYQEDPFARPGDGLTTLKYDPLNFSPDLNIKYLLTERSNLRFASSITTTRPRLREILPTVYQDGDGNQIIGNPELENSTNYNLDLKYEIFPTNDQIFSLTAFGKYLHSPIERLSRATSVGYRTFFANFDEALLYGLELEAILNIGNTLRQEDLEDFTFGVNGILMNSKATAKESNPDFAAVTNLERELQGASNWGINANLGYELIDTNETESTLNLIFNTFGERIYAVGVEGAGEIYEKPVNQLDFVWNTQFNEHWGLRINVKNILNEKTMFTQDATREIRDPQNYSNVIESFAFGISFGANISYKF